MVRKIIIYEIYLKNYVDAYCRLADDGRVFNKSQTSPAFHPVRRSPAAFSRLASVQYALAFLDRRNR